MPAAREWLSQSAPSCIGAAPCPGRKRSSVVPWRNRPPVTWSKRTSTTSSGRSGCQSADRSVLHRLGPPGALPVKPGGATIASSRCVSAGRSSRGMLLVKPT